MRILSLVTFVISLLCLLLGGAQLRSIGSYALAGALTNGIAVYILIDRVFVPRKFEELKNGLRRIILESLLGSPDKILQAIDRDVLFEKLMGAVQTSSFGSMLGLVGGIEGLKKTLHPPFERKIEEAIREIMASPRFNEKIEQVVKNRLDEITLQKITAPMREHLGWLVVWGGVCGAILGFGASFL